MIEGANFHHVGVACRDLAAEQAHFAMLGYRPEGNTFEDPRQRIRGLFLTAPGQPRLELLVNARETGPLDPWLAKGVKFYHFAYEVPALDRAIEDLKTARARVMVPPVPAVAFDMRRITFLMHPNGTLTELIEAA